MGVRITLIGRPEIHDGDQPMRIRGEKAWAVLARVVLADRPLSRRRLAADLFPDAEDPLGSLRWCLAELRRAIGSADAFTGDPVAANLPAGTDVDVVSLARGDFDRFETVGELLGGINPRCGPEFDTWLLVERQRAAALLDAELRQRVLGALSLRAFDRAVRLGELAVSRTPFDESAHVLFVKALVGAGLHAAAERHITATCELFRDELDVEPSAALRDAARRTIAEPAPGVAPAAVAAALLEAGTAALDAGAVDAGIECLRRAADESDRSGDVELRARALLELGTALVHAVRGYDDEGAVLLREAADLGRSCGASPIAAEALQELGYTDALVGRRPTASAYLDEAANLAADVPALVAGVEAVQGFNLAEWGRFADGVTHFARAIELARETGKPRREAWSTGIGARAHMLAGDIDRAEEWLRRCLDLVADEQWMSFRPWPSTLLAELELLAGRDATAVRCELEETFALSCQLGDPCWEGAAARAIALSHASQEQHDEALRWIAEARRRCTRETDTYVGMTASILATDAELSARAGESLRSEAAARELLTLAARTHQDHFVRSALTMLGIDDDG